MSAIFDLKAFYKNINNESREKTFEVGHFDIFKIEDMALSMSLDNGGYRGYPTLASIQENAMDKKVAGRLWDLAEEVTGVVYPL